MAGAGTKVLHKTEKGKAGSAAAKVAAVQLQNGLISCGSVPLYHSKAGKKSSKIAESFTERRKTMANDKPEEPEVIQAQKAPEAAEAPDTAEEAKAILAAAINLTPDTFMEARHGILTDDLAAMAKMKMKEEEGRKRYSMAHTTAAGVTLKLSIKGQGEGLTDKEVNKAIELLTSSPLGIGAHKLLSLAVCQYTAMMDFKRSKDSAAEPMAKDLIGHIPFLAYIKALGYDTDSKDSIDNARREVYSDLLKLRAMAATSGKHRNIGYFGSAGIENGEIIYSLTAEFGMYLAETRTITPYSMNLLQIPAKHRTAYALGNKMVTLAMMDSNRKKGTSGTVKVKNLLNVTGLPSFEETRKKRQSWRKCIKTPFEEALDLLTLEYNVLDSWEYTLAKREPIPDDEAFFDSYLEWEEVLVTYTLHSPPDDSSRLEAREAEKQKADKRREKLEIKKQALRELQAEEIK